MPVTETKPDRKIIYQRDQYAKAGPGRRHWDQRDKSALNLIRPFHRIIVEPGCGEGITLEKMHRLFPDRTVFGIDILTENIEICKKHGCNVQQGDVYHLPLLSTSVDAVMFMEVIEHLNHPETAIREIHRVLVPGGRLVIVFPNDLIFKIARLIFLRFDEAAFDPGHVKQWTPDDMSRLLKKNGFTPVFMKNIPFRLWPISLHCIMAADKK